MSKSIDLEQQRKRAKDLVRSHRQGEPDAVARLQRNLPRAANLPRERVLALPVQLADAQLVIAREAGFPTWPRLKHHVERLRDRAGVPLHEAVRAGDAAAVRAVLAAGPPSWQTREAIEEAVERDDREIVQVLLEHHAWADTAGRRWGRWGGCLHSALLLGRDVELVELLARGGVSLAARDRDGRTPLAIAVRTGNAAAAAVLRRHGASEAEVGDVDRALGACVRGERPAAPAARWILSDHQHVCWAIRAGHHDAVPALLALGLDADVPDDDGETALHLAVAARALPALDAVLAADVRVDAWNYRNETPLTCASREPDDVMRGALVTRLVAAGATFGDPDDLSELFEDAVEAVIDGELARLTALLDREPRLVTARSLRTHHATLLNYVGANGVEDDRQRSPRNAGEIASLLLARGADPNALAFTYGGGPAQTTLYLAVTSDHPVKAGVMDDIIHALVRGGATIEEHDRDALQASQRSALPALVAAGARVDLWLAAALGRLDDVQRLVALDGTLQPGAKLGSDVPRPDRDVIDRAFRAACTAGHTAVAAHLIAAGARVAAPGDQGMTALHLASWHADLATARLLIDHGAPLEAKNDYGGTVLGMAVWVVRNDWHDGVDYAALLELLIAAGADLGRVSGGATGREPVDAVLRRHGKLGGPAA